MDRKENITHIFQMYVINPYVYFSNITVHGGWSDWTSWTECTMTCGKEAGQHSRNRSCDNPVPEWGGDECAGDTEEIQYCNDFYCPSRYKRVILIVEFKRKRKFGI